MQKSMIKLLMIMVFLAFGERNETRQDSLVEFTGREDLILVKEEMAVLQKTSSNE
ncbi:MAG: hypothetical protein ACLS8D_13760 [Clostridioides difficile]